MLTIAPGTTLYTILRHVSKSGTTRSISVIGPDFKELTSQMIYAFPDYFKSDRRYGGIKVHGVGMDMGFSLVYDLGILLHNDGSAFRQRWL